MIVSAQPHTTNTPTAIIVPLLRIVALNLQIHGYIKQFLIQLFEFVGKRFRINRKLANKLHSTFWKLSIRKVEKGKFKKARMRVETNSLSFVFSYFLATMQMNSTQRIAALKSTQLANYRFNTTK